MMTAEQALAAQRANIEILFGLTSKAFEGVEKLVELNLQVARTAMTEAADTARAVLSIKDAQELMAFQASLLQPAAEKASAYSRHIYEIATVTNADVTKAAEASVAEAQKKFVAVVDSATKNAPAGSENVVAFVKSAVAAASNAFDGVQKAARQAAEVTEANFHAMTANATRATQSAPKVKRPT